MTRFARAKGSKASNEKKPEEATPWSEMRQGVLSKSGSSVESKPKPSITARSFTTKNEIHKPSEWVPLGDVDGSDGILLLRAMKKKWLEGETQSEALSKNGNTITDKNCKKSIGLSPPCQKDLGENSKGKKRKKDEDLVNAFPSDKKKKKMIVTVNGEASDVVGKKLKQRKKDKEHSVPEKMELNLSEKTEKSEQHVKKPKEMNDITVNSSINMDAGIEKKSSKRKRSKKENDGSKSVKENKEATENAEQITSPGVTKETKKKKKKNDDSSNLKNGPFVEKVHNVQKSNRNFENSSGCKSNNSNNNKNLSSSNNKNLKSRKTNNDKFKSPVANGRKKKGPSGIKSGGREMPGIIKGITEMFINGEKVSIAHFDGFPIKAEDAERIKKLKRDMIEKGIPTKDVQNVIKLERRRAEKALVRLRKSVCFNCRKSGHNLSDCPEIVENHNTVTGICYKCGSTEHTAFHCKVAHAQQFRFAKCFICREQGHIAQQCPDNPRGLYPKGGACKVCGDVTHLKKDCPKFVSQKEDETVTLSTRNNRSVEALEEEEVYGKKDAPSSVTKKNRCIRF